MSKPIKKGGMGRNIQEKLLFRMLLFRITDSNDIGCHWTAFFLSSLKRLAQSSISLIQIGRNITPAIGPF